MVKTIHEELNAAARFFFHKLLLTQLSPPYEEGWSIDARRKVVINMFTLISN